MNSDLDKKTFDNKSGTFVRLPVELMSRGIYLTTEAKWVYASLQRFYGKAKQVYPSYEVIMAYSGMKRNAVAKALKELEYFKWIEKKKNIRKSTTYILNAPSWIEAPDDPVPTEEIALEWRKQQKQTRQEKDSSMADRAEALKIISSKKKK